MHQLLIEPSVIEDIKQGDRAAEVMVNGNVNNMKK
jgi:hypothetical protein